MTSNRIRETGALRAFVLGAFLLGVFTAPLRSCLTHGPSGHHGASVPPFQHAHAASGPEHHRHQGFGHTDGGAPGDHAPQAGCDCLGLCQLESGPPMQVAGAFAALPDAHRTAALPVTWDHAPSLGLAYPVPLARAPPTSA